MKWWAICFLFSLTTLAVEIPQGIVPMVQTLTDETSTQINLLAGKGASWKFAVTLRSGTQKTDPEIAVEQIYHGNAMDKVYQLVITGLASGGSYTLAIRDGKRPLEERHFKTFGQNQKIRFALGSCSSDNPSLLAEGKLIWQQLARLAPNLILLSGDTIYVDDSHALGFKKRPQENQIWQRYADSFKQIHLFKLKNLIPVLATWDDHDYGINDGDKTWARPQGGWYPVKESTKAFKAFLGGEALRTAEDIGHWHQNGPGVSSRTDVLGHRFVFLDNRSFRAPRDSTSDYAHFGKKQEQFLHQQILSSDSPLFVVNGGQFFGGYLQRDSFEHVHPTHFNLFKDRIKTLYTENPSLPPFALISGDIHFSEVMEIEKEQVGFQTYEFTASPWHSYVRGVHSNPKYSSLKNPRRIKSIEGFNFMLATSAPNNDGSSGFQLKVKAYGARGEIKGFSKTYSIKTR